MDLQALLDQKKLPAYLQESLELMQAAWDRLDRGEEDLRWDCDWCRLQSDINNAEVGGAISNEEAWYLREKYLRMERPEVFEAWLLEEEERVKKKFEEPEL